MALKIAVLDDYQSVALASGPWHELGPDVEVVPWQDHVADPGELARRLEGYQVVVAMRERTPFPAALLAAVPDLRLLVTTGMQNAAIDVAAARRLGITVCGTDSDLSSTVELTWALVLAVTRNLVVEDAAVRSGGWQHTVGRGLRGDVLGVVGLGRIGSQVAAIGRAFGMEVLAWSQNLTAERARAAGACLVDADDLLRRSDVVSLHLRLSERTRGLIGAREFGLMKPSAVLVNTSRGPLVDGPALVASLAAGTLRGAGLDVYDQEPLAIDSPLRSRPEVVLSPHLGYVTEQAYALFYGQVVADVAAFLSGAPVRVLGDEHPLGPAR